jgi:hypothetical protein
MKPIHVFISLVAAAVFLSSGSAMATDRKIHHGSMCQPQSISNANALGAFTEGAVNTGTNSIVVTCPIVRDNTQNTTGTAKAFSNVRSSGGQLLSCTLVSRDKNGNFIASKFDSTTSNSPDSLDLDVNASAVLGSYAIFCILPPSGRIFNYDIDEF